MKRTTICIVFFFLFVWAASAQTKVVTGTVANYDASWQTLAVKVKARNDHRCNQEYGCSYIVFTRASGAYGCTPKTCKYPAPKIDGNVKSVGQTVRVSYSRIDDEHGFGYILRATKIVEIKRSGK